jgi:hypothetical protein
MNGKKQPAVEVFENEMRDKLCRENDGDRLFADLTGLFMDIIGEISQTDKEKAVIIYDYAKLLEQEIQLYSGMEAYTVGRESKSQSENEVISGYMCKVATKKNEQRLYSRIQALFDEILRLVGGKSGLITDFTETYRAVHGGIVSNIHEFIRLGQTCETDMTAVG